MPVVSQRLSRIPQSPTAGLGVLRESLEQLQTNLPFSLLEERVCERIIIFEFGESSICDLVGDLFDEVGCQGAADVVADAVCEPDEIFEADVVFLVEVTEAIDDQVL
jgi:hypothetical protein